MIENFILGGCLLLWGLAVIGPWDRSAPWYPYATGILPFICVVILALFHYGKVF